MVSRGTGFIICVKINNVNNQRNLISSSVVLDLGVSTHGVHLWLLCKKQWQQRQLINQYIH